MKRLTFLFLILALTAFATAQDRADQEIVFPGDAFAKLDTFEALNLEDADKLFGKKDYKGAYAAYKAYSFEFTQSEALGYALLRMGRCLHQIDKRNAAITAYQDVVDYFPDDVRYAAAALYYIGECHGQNGDDAKKTATWARMVKDDDYVAQPRSGTALTYLGKSMEELGKFEEATEYHWRTATTFLATNPAAAQAARGAVINHYVRRSPNHDKLKEFFVAASGFDGSGRETEKPEEDARYWTTTLSTALGTKGEADEREKTCAYWSAKMGDRFVDDDGVRKLWIDALAAHEKDAEAWLARMEKQFAHKPADLARVYQWCGYYNRDREMRSEFYAKHGQPLFAALQKFEEKMRALDQLRRLQMNDEVIAAARSISPNGLADAELAQLGGFVALYQPEEAVIPYFARMKDKTAAAKARFDYYNARYHRNAPFMEKALAEIPVLQKSPEHSSPDLVFAQGRLLQGLTRYDEAIKAYRAANKPKDSAYGIADCLVALKQYPQAVKTMKDLEFVGGDVAAGASLKIADIYRTAGDKGKEVTQLRAVLKSYPKSGQSSEAHNRLESYGVALVGGEAEAEE